MREACLATAARPAAHGHPLQRRPAWICARPPHQATTSSTSAPAMLATAPSPSDGGGCRLPTLHMALVAHGLTPGTASAPPRSFTDRRHVAPPLPRPMEARCRSPSPTFGEACQGPRREGKGGEVGRSHVLSVGILPQRQCSTGAAWRQGTAAANLWLWIAQKQVGRRLGCTLVACFTGMSTAHETCNGGGGFAQLW